MKVLFMGTPDFALGCLLALIENKYDVCGVFTQPDKPKGRGYELSASPVKQMALEKNIPVFQPSTLKNGEAFEIIKELNPDIIVVVAYGKILPKDILDFPKFGCINIHASLLPKLRGAAPINFAIINGDKKTGVTSMYMNEGLDTGDMLLKEEVEINDDQTAGELFEVLSVLGARVLIKTLEKIKDNTITRQPQDESMATYASIIDKKLGKIDFNKSALQVHNLIRGTNPWPGAFASLNGKTMKVLKSKIKNEIKEAPPGEVIFADTKNGLVISCGEGAIIIQQLQFEGKKRMEATEFLKGNKIEIGTILGN